MGKLKEIEERHKDATNGVFDAQTAFYINAYKDIAYLLNRVRKLEGLLTETKPFLARFRPLHEADDRQLSSLLKAIVQALEGDGDEG